MMKKTFLAVDLGGSKYMTGLVSSDGEVLYSKRFLWERYSQEDIRRQIMESIEETLSVNPGIKVEAAGVTIPGLADPEKGLWLSPEFMGVRNYPVAAEIHGVFGFPVFIENDGRACVLAERCFGAGKDCDDFLYITVSNGVGGGLFLNGNLYSGAYGNAGEIGQCVVVENGRMSPDGTAGTLEMYAAAAGLVQNYILAGGSAAIDGAPADGKSIAALAAKGDPAALCAFRSEGYYLGKAIATANNLLDIKKVIIGGGISLAFDYFKDSLIQTVKEQTYKRNYPTPEILPTPLGYEGALLGAAAVALLGSQATRSNL
jgi:predicted NBD/HSP70 family sugar kinase